MFNSIVGTVGAETEHGSEPGISPSHSSSCTQNRLNVLGSRKSNPWEDEGGKRTGTFSVSLSFIMIGYWRTDVSILHLRTCMCTAYLQPCS